MDTLFWIGVLLIAGYAAGRVSERFRLPKVTGYMLIGMVLSPSVTNLLPVSFIEHTGPITHLALAVIAFMIGGSLKFETIKKLEKSIFCIMFSASEMTFLVVTLGLVLLLPYSLSERFAAGGGNTLFETALFLGAIGAATAPAAVLAVVHQYRAKGPLTTTLLGVVATDDAIALINFSLALAVVAFLNGNGTDTLLSALQAPLVSIGVSVLAGAGVGWLQGQHINRISQESNLLISTFGLLLLLYAAMEHFAWDALLACMSYGLVLTNTVRKGTEVFRMIQHHFEEIIFVLFFIISGATIELLVVAEVWPVALLYVVLRMVGKTVGSRIGAEMVGAPETVRNYIGLAQMPQAGVAIGLALTLFHDAAFGYVGVIVLNTVIAATMINEIIGPLLLKYVLIKSGEAKEEP